MTNTNTKWYEQYKNTKWVLPVSCSHSASGQERLISYNLPSATEPGNNFTTIFGLGLWSTISVAVYF